MKKISNSKFVLNCTDGTEKPFSFAPKVVTGQSFLDKNKWCNCCLRWGTHLSEDCPNKVLDIQQPLKIKVGEASMRDEDLEDYLNNHDQKYFCCSCKTYITSSRIKFLKTIASRLESEYNCVKCAFKMDKDLTLGVKFKEALNNRKQEEDEARIERWENEHFHVGAGMD